MSLTPALDAGFLLVTERAILVGVAIELQASRIVRPHGRPDLKGLCAGV